MKATSDPYRAMLGVICSPRTQAEHNGLLAFCNDHPWLDSNGLQPADPISDSWQQHQMIVAVLLSLGAS